MARTHHLSDVPHVLQADVFLISWVRDSRTNDGLYMLSS